jgi:methionyl-tRNA formyltransferase
LTEIASLHNITLHTVDNINSDDCAHILKKLNLDIMLGMGTSIIKSKILKIPRLGILNGHSSLLPDYRGGTTEFWQLANDEDKTGVTIHLMIEKLDAGDIIAQGSWEIPKGTNHIKMRLASAFERTRLWKIAVRNIAQGGKGIPQGESYMSVFKFPNLNQLYNHYVLRKKPME